MKISVQQDRDQAGTKTPCMSMLLIFPELSFVKPLQRLKKGVKHNTVVS